MSYKDFKPSGKTVFPSNVKTDDTEFAIDNLKDHLKKFNKSEDKRSRKEWINKARELLDKLS